MVPKLNDEALWEDHFYLVPSGVNSLNFMWILTVLHRTSSWEYFLLTHNNTLLALFNYKNAIPQPQWSTWSP